MGLVRIHLDVHLHFQNPEFELRHVEIVTGPGVCDPCLVEFLGRYQGPLVKLALSLEVQLPFCKIDPGAVHPGALPGQLQGLGRVRFDHGKHIPR